jgi:integrase
MRGSVYQRGNGKYTAVTEPQRAADGSKRRRSLGTFGTAEEAERALATYNGATHSDDPILGRSDPTIADIASRWKDKQQLRCEAGAIARLTRQGYDSIVDTHLIPELGSIRISGLTPQKLELYQLELKARGLSDRTAVSIWRVLSMVIKDARLGSNPCASVDAPRIRSRKRTVRPTVEQVNTFLNHTKHCPRCGSLAEAWRLAATTGLRRGELSGLAWSDLDLRSGRLTVNRSVGKDREHFIKKPKSDVGVRTIGLDMETVDMLIALKLNRTEGPSASPTLKPIMGHDLVLRNYRTGTLCTPDQLSHNFKTHWQHSGLPPEVSLHGLRHSHGSALLLQGLPVTQVAARMGHDPHVLLSIYAGELDSESRQTAMAAAAEAMYTTQTRL